MTRFLTPLLIALGLVLAAPAALALDADEMFTDPAQEARARELGRQLRCVKCRNQSIFDSNAGIAKDMRVLVRERMVAGDSDAEVLDYIYQRYGDYVLLKPRWGGQNLVLWAAPLGLTLLALGGGALYLRRRNPAPGAVELSAEDRAAAQALLAEETRP